MFLTLLRCGIASIRTLARLREFRKNSSPFLFSWASAEIISEMQNCPRSGSNRRPPAIYSVNVLIR